MWDDIDTGGIVVNVYFPNSARDKISTLKHSQDGSRKYNELCAIKNGFYQIRAHKITPELEYTTLDILLPVSMAYLVRMGKLADFEKGVEYWYAVTSGGLEIRHMDQVRLMEMLILEDTGERVFLLTDRYNVRLESGGKVEDFLPRIKKGVISVGHLRNEQKESVQ